MVSAGLTVKLPANVSCSNGHKNPPPLRVVLSGNALASLTALLKMVTSSNRSPLYRQPGPATNPNRIPTISLRMPVSVAVGFLDQCGERSKNHTLRIPSLLGRGVSGREAADRRPHELDHCYVGLE